MYVATVLLKRSERNFWKLTPRKLTALAKVHIEVEGGGSDEKKEESAKSKVSYIDQVM
jgi:hypothetical protein